MIRSIFFIFEKKKYFAYSFGLYLINPIKKQKNYSKQDYASNK